MTRAGVKEQSMFHSPPKNKFDHTVVKRTKTKQRRNNVNLPKINKI